MQLKRREWQATSVFNQTPLLLLPPDSLSLGGRRAPRPLDEDVRRSARRRDRLVSLSTLSRRRRRSGSAQRLRLTDSGDTVRPSQRGCQGERGKAPKRVRTRPSTAVSVHGPISNSPRRKGLSQRNATGSLSDKALIRLQVHPLENLHNMRPFAK